jgi:sarcosine oxidase
VKIGVSSASSPKPYLDTPEDNRYPIDSRDTDPPEHFTRRAFPGLNPVAAAAEPCMNSKTPDRDFILGTTCSAPDIVLAGGFSGHGFKHAAASGDVAVDLALEGATELDLTRFDPNRLM